MPEQIPNAEELEFKEKFTERYSKLTDFEEFKKYSLSFLRRSIRANTIKISISELKKRLEKNWTLEQIPWCKEGFYIEHIKKERRDIGNLIEHSLGYFYTQEAASMIPPLVLEPKEDDIVLDMAASPGSKTTQIAALMNNKGILVANDINSARMKPLSLNVQRCGITNCIVTIMYGQRFSGFEFDRILLDAPCSGTGTIRKSLKTLRIWNPLMVQRLAHTQKSLIDIAFNNLKKEGILVYSTCSNEPEENEAVIDFLVNKYENAKLEDIRIDGLNRSKPILEFENNNYNEEIR
ncbi:MAG: NOL1/NOP2/sun family putative RNA methylase, partial [Nanoarchaeota archaeon]